MAIPAHPAQSVDTTIRLARRYWQLEGQPDRNVIISRWNGYHGSTIAGASLGGMKWMHEQGLLPMPGVEHINRTGAVIAGALPLLYGMAEGIVAGATYQAPAADAERPPAVPASGTRRSRFHDAVGYRP